MFQRLVDAPLRTRRLNRSERAAAAMDRYEFNVLRLPINWSKLEPYEDEFSEQYFQKPDEVIDLCLEAGL